MNTHHRKFLIFTLNNSNTWYALDLAHIAEVSDPTLLTPIPLSPDYYCGAYNFHGNIVAVINSADFLGLTVVDKTEKVIVLNQDIASLALTAARIVRIILEGDAMLTEGSDMEYAHSNIKFADGEAVLLDIEMIVNKAGIDLKNYRS